MSILTNQQLFEKHVLDCPQCKAHCFGERPTQLTLCRIGLAYQKAL